jgi:hypothetical protein|tara:strand:+ start:246 stop:776 length:531 start_codon:yes stop_codon:yes gene_type:complete
MTKIAVNQFAKRQVADSKYSHYEGTWKELVALVESRFGEVKPGYRDGVVLLSAPPEGFFSGVVELTEGTPLRAVFSSRRKGEEPYLQVEAVGGDKLPAKVVEVVLYRHDVLGRDASSEAEWEIISINARPTDEPEPATPVAMARNFLELPGGTKADYSAEEFAKAIIYWSRRAMRG